MQSSEVVSILFNLKPDPRLTVWDMLYFWLQDPYSKSYSQFVNGSNFLYHVFSKRITQLVFESTFPSSGIVRAIQTCSYTMLVSDGVQRR